MNTHVREPAPSEGRDFFIPVRKTDLIDALLAEPGLLEGAERGKFAQFNRLLGSIFHFDYFARLETLRDAYHDLDPERTAEDDGDPGRFAKTYAAFVKAFEALLKGANFVEVPADEVERSYREHAVLQVKVETPLEDFHAVRFFRRGLGLETFEVRELWGWRKRSIEVQVYDTVVLLAAIKPRAAIASEQQLERLKRSKVPTGSVLIKCFRKIASADINMLLPNVRVVMSFFDKLMLGIPALVGGVPIVLKLVSTVTVLFVVAGFYLGLSGAVHDDDQKAAIAALGGLVALGGFMIRQWVKYERQSLRYLKEITDKVFFRSLTHNAGFFDYILSAAEDQELKEALLAYCFLHDAQAPLAPSDLRLRIENWLKSRFPLVIRFEIRDALHKLFRLGLVQRDGATYTALPIDAAVDRLNGAWADLFRAGPPTP